jgi:hypothetical protein
VAHRPSVPHAGVSGPSGYSDGATRWPLLARATSDPTSQASSRPQQGPRPAGRPPQHSRRVHPEPIPTQALASATGARKFEFKVIQTLRESWNRSISLGGNDHIDRLQTGSGCERSESRAGVSTIAEAT